jgi:hypothetical protein
MKVHAGFGEQRSRIEVIRKLLDHFAHGVVIGLGRLPAVRLGIGRKTQRHGLDVSLLGGRSATREINRLLDSRMGRCETVVAGGIVVVGPYGLGYSPIGHGQFGVKICGALKRARCFVVVESIDLTQSLIEELLGLRVVGRYRVMQVAIALHQSRRLRLSVRRMILCGDHAAEKHT